MERKKKPIKKKSVDFILLISIIALVFIGLIMVFSSSWPEGMVQFNDGYYFLKSQLFAVFLGFLGMIFFMNFKYTYFKKLALPIFILAIILGLLIFTPLGENAKGARRWVDLGFIRFMPSDAIKLGSIIFYAAFLSNKGEKIKTLLGGSLPSLLIIGICCGLIYFQKDLGTTVTLAGTLVAMFFIAGMNLYHLGFIGVVSIAGLFYAVMGEGNEYRLERILAFRDPFAEKLGSGWQAVQSLYALGSGGIFGLGLGKSRQKFFYIPEAHNDFIFAILGEELGLLGTLLVLILFMLVIWRGIIIAMKTEDTFGSYLAAGITALIGIQSLINIAVVTSSIPTTGITLPFISFGGTSLLFSMAGIGILLNISRYAKLDRS